MEKIDFILSLKSEKNFLEDFPKLKENEYRFFNLGFFHSEAYDDPEIRKWSKSEGINSSIKLFGEVLHLIPKEAKRVYVDFDMSKRLEEKSSVMSQSPWEKLFNLCKQEGVRILIVTVFKYPF